MEDLLLYIFESGVFITVLYLLFKLLMSRTTLFRFNRILILFGIILCALLPFIDISQLLPSFYEFQNHSGVGNSNLSHENLTGFHRLIEDITILTADTSYILYVKVLFFIYLGGAFIVGGHYLISMHRMLRLIAKSDKEKYKDYTLVIVDQPICSFNWGKYIVLSINDYRANSNEVLLHEKMHLNNKHTLDLFLMEIFIILHWFNPAIWLLRKELRDIHEFEADNQVIHTGIDATRYQLLLVKKAVGTRLYSMTNGFNHSKLKNRIRMMLKRKTSKWARLRVVLFVPAMAVVLCAFVLMKQKNPSEKEGKIVEGIELTFHSNNQVVKTLKDFTMKELKDELQKAWKKDGDLAVGLKITPNVPQEAVLEVKEALRESAILKLNYSLSNS